MWGSRAIAVGCGLVGFFTTSCSWLNTLDVCGDAPSEARVNQRGDQSEFTGHPRAAASPLDTNRVLVAFVAQPLDQSSSVVRLASLDATTGERGIVCGSEFEYTLSDPSVLSYAATIAPVDLVVNGHIAKAAVAWMENEVDFRAKLVFLDSAGCPLGKPFTVAEATQVSAGPALAWSPTKKALMVAFHDTQNVFMSWVTDTSPGFPIKLGGAFRIAEPMTAAIADDGRGLVGWVSYADADAMVVGKPDIRVALVGADGNLRPGPTGAAEPFPVTFPAAFDSTGTVDLFVASRNARYAVAASLGISELARQVVYVTELSAEDGQTVTAPYRVDSTTGAAHFFPSMAYAPDDTLVVAWQTPDRNGTVARLFDSSGNPRFSSVSCDEEPFAVGARAREGMQGQPSVLFKSGRLWIVHPGQPGYDSVAMGTVGWHEAWSRLWPAR